MLGRSIKFSVAPLVLAALGGCSTYPASRPAFAYYAVPCSTPGAFVVEPIEPLNSPNGAQASSPVPFQPIASAAENGKASPQTCMIAAPIGQARYSGRGYFDPYSYGFGTRYYGSFGIGLYGGGHGRRSYGGHGGGHHGGSHGGHGNH